jgi:glutathione S-transferase
MCQQIQDLLTRLEQHLGSNKFLVRDTFSLADICFALRITILNQLGAPLPSSYANVRMWIAIAISFETAWQFNSDGLRCS